MPLSLRRPPLERVRAFLSGQRERSLTYDEVGWTARGEAPAGWDHDHNRAHLGDGEAAWRAAREAIRGWRMMPAPWVLLAGAAGDPGRPPPVAEGETVALLIRVLGLWWTNASRIVYTIDEPEGPVARYGFAYGTLPAHVERGEEAFVVERLEDGSVWYDLRAFSRPRHPLARLGYPLARRFQRRFVRDSQTALRRAVAGGAAGEAGPPGGADGENG